MQRKALHIYWLASCLAVLAASVLYILGLDLSFAQARTVILFGFPAPVIMYLCDRGLIIRHVRPIDVVCQKHTAGQVIPSQEARRAYIQALNLPVLTLLRVLLVHAPAVLLPVTGLALVANRVADLQLAGWQFVVIWSLWPIVAAPHAILEYFLIERLTRDVLAQLEPYVGDDLSTPPPRASAAVILRLLLGQQPSPPQLIRTATGTQLAWLFFFVSLMPMLVLGASVYLKTSTLSPAVSQVDRAMVGGPAVVTPRALGLWIAFLILLNAGVSVAIVTLMSRRVRSSMADLLEQMQRVVQGDLSRHWYPRATDEFLDLGSGFNTMLAGLRERAAIMDTFGRFVSHDVAEAVLTGQVPLHGELREVTILFQDMRSFTTLSERTPPAALIHLMNEFFTEMVAAVEIHGGIIKQFTGDGVMALFGAPACQDESPTQAVRAALTMCVHLAALNQRRQARGEALLRIGVGIHTGEVVAGCIGPDKRMEYGVVGDAVNLASRVQELTKQVGVTILATDTTVARLGPEFMLGKRAVLPVRGRAQPIEVVEIRVVP